MATTNEPFEEKYLKETEERSDLAEERTDLSEVRTKLSETRTDLSYERRDLSIQRTHLSNQRTFQSWIRTSLSLIGFGFAMAEFLFVFTENGQEKSFYFFQTNLKISSMLGLSLIIIGMILTVLAYVRYLQIKKKIGPDFNISYPGTSLLTVISTIAISAFFLIYTILRL